MKKEPTAPTGIPALSVARFEGSLELQQGDAWQSVSTLAATVKQPFSWISSSRLRAGKEPGQITLSNGTRVTLNTETEVRIAGEKPAALALDRGEILCEVPEKGGDDVATTVDKEKPVRLVIRVPDGVVQVTGTRFDVRLSPRKMEVAVLDGRVELGNEKGRTVVPAGHAAELPEGKAPFPAYRTNVEKWCAWRMKADSAMLRPPQGSRILYEEDFSSDPVKGWGGIRKVWADQGSNDVCMAPAVEALLREAVVSPWQKKGWSVGPRTYLRFRYFARDFSPRDQLSVTFKEKEQKNYFGHLFGVASNRWETATLRLADLVFAPEPRRHLMSGETVYQVYWSATVGERKDPKETPFLIKDVVLFEAAQELPVHLVTPVWEPK